jgi:hypothetical protein
VRDTFIAHDAQAVDAFLQRLVAGADLYRLARQRLAHRVCAVYGMDCAVLPGVSVSIPSGVTASGRMAS